MLHEAGMRQREDKFAEQCILVLARGRAMRLVGWHSLDVPPSRHVQERSRTVVMRRGL